MACSKGLKTDPSSEQTQLGDQIPGEALNSLEERVLVGAGMHGTLHALLPRCPPGKISWADVAQL